MKHFYMQLSALWGYPYSGGTANSKSTLSCLVPTFITGVPLSRPNQTVTEFTYALSAHKLIRKLSFFLALVLLNTSVWGQGLQMTCPSDITTNVWDKCEAVVTYTNPIPTIANVFNYTGEVQTYTVPAGVTSVKVDVVGASGGYSYPSSSNIPGLGGRVQADIAVIPGDVLYIYVGGKGTDGRAGAGITAPGGYNGGGLGNNARDSYKGGGGGGATDIRLNGKSLADRIVVAGGGAGSAFDNGSGDDGGNGGDLVGAAGKYGGSSNPKAGVGGTQSSGGAAGVYPVYESGTAGTLAVGGSGGVGTSGGGGGGGYYGGGGGSWAGGGGGSSFTFAGSSNVVHTQGYQTGNGLVKISLPSNTVTLTQIAGLPSGAPFPLGTTVNTYKATDTYGNSVTCSFKVIVNDKTNPTITAPAPVTIGTDPGKNTASGVILGIPTTSDNCQVTTIENNAPTVFPLGQTTVLWTVMDAAGNKATAIQQVTVNDTKAPVPTIADLAEITAECGVTVTRPTATDEVDGLITATTTEPLTYASQGEYTITWKYTDKSGNEATQAQQVVVKDITAPVIGKKVSKVAIIGGWGVSDMQAFLASEGYTANALPAVPDAAALATYDAVVLLRTTGNNDLANWVKNGGLLITEWTASEWALNSAKLLNATHEAFGCNGNTPVTFAATVNGTKLGHELPNPYTESGRTECFITFAGLGEGVEVLATRAGKAAILGGTSGAGYSMIIGYDWGDGFPATPSLTGTLLLNALTFGSSVPTDIAVSASSVSCDAIVNYATPVANDNCSAVTVTQTAGLASGSVFPLGVTTNTFVAKDAAGNETAVSFTVTVIDDVKPTVLVRDLTVQLGAEGKATITPAMVNNGSSDNCSIPANGYSIDKTSFSCSDLGENEVTLTVTDVHGNSDSRMATVTVEDKTAPLARAKGITVQLNADGAVVITPEMVNDASADPCGGVTLALSKTAFDCSNVGANTVTLTVTDASGNTATATATVTVEDKTAPVASAKSITVQLDATGNATIAAADVDNNSADVCGAVTLSIDKTNFDCSNIGANTVILTVTDKYGNAATTTATVTIEDKTAPTVLAKNITIQLDAAGNATLVAEDLDNGSLDICSALTFSADKTTFDCSNLGANTVALTVTDASGNKATTTATVTVEDKIAPTITAPAAVVVNVDAGKTTASNVDLGTPVTADNCAVASITNNAPADYATGTTTVTWTVTDAAGNTVTATQTVTVRPNITAVTTPAIIKVPIRTTYANVPLPAKVEVTYSNGEKAQLGVNWQQGNYKGTVAAAYTLTGTLVLFDMTTNLDNLNATVVVEVQPNKVPTALAFSATTFKPEAAAADAIGTLTTTDADDNTFVYELVAGQGDVNNALFEIRNDKVYLKSNEGLSGMKTFSIRVRSTDSYHNTIEKSFTLTKELYSKPTDELKIVNAFSPNGDGVNDDWTIPELRFYNNVYIQVFDRSGVRVFETTNPETGWNGYSTNGQLLKGPYLYIIEVKDINWVKKGVVTILSK